MEQLSREREDSSILKEPIKVLSRFEGGGLGELLRCKDANGVSFAAKLPKDQSVTNQRLIVDEERRFHRHQGVHVVQYYGTIQHTDGRRGFAMELMEGSLSGLIETGGAIRRGRAIAYLADAISGLAEVTNPPTARTTAISSRRTSSTRMASRS